MTFIIDLFTCNGENNHDNFLQEGSLLLVYQGHVSRFPCAYASCDSYVPLARTSSAEVGEIVRRSS